MSNLADTVSREYSPQIETGQARVFTNVKSYKGNP